jgi:hypothetical protein
MRDGSHKSKWRARFPEVETFPPSGYIADFLEFRHLPLYRDRRFLHQKYVVEGLSIAQISAQIFSSKEAVRRGLLNAGIQPREAHKPHGRPARVKFGEKKRQGKLVTHLAERRVIEAVRDMRRSSLSLRQIARFLTRVGVPTKRRGIAWHPEMVKRLLASIEQIEHVGATMQVEGVDQSETTA